MIRKGIVQNFTKQAQQGTTPGLYGIFGKDDLECEALWGYVEGYSLTCDGVIINTPQREVTFRNGASVRVFCASWRTHVGMRVNDVLFADDSIRQHVYSQIRCTPPTSAPEPPPRFGL